MSELGQLLIKMVRAKAAHFPDFVYQPEVNDDSSCQYIHANGGPGCLIGQALFEAGLIDGSLYVDEMNQKSVRLLADTLDLPLSEKELDWFNIVQVVQDSRKPWSLAVSNADRRVGL